MELSEILSAISTVGFPIIMTLIIFNALNKEREDHKIEVEQLKTVINENNNILAALKQLIEDRIK